MNFSELAEITSFFDECGRLLPYESLEVSAPLSLEDSFMIQPRLQRAAENQEANGLATLPRYRIWAETLRGAVVSAVKDLEEEKASDETRRNLIRVANSLASFTEIQNRFDPSL